jgi:hypothetical protein
MQDGMLVNRWKLHEGSLELCVVAVAENPDALQYVPDVLREKFFNKTGAIKWKDVIKEIGGGILEYIPEKAKTEKLCILAVKDNGRALEYVPENYKTEEMCSAAVKSNGSALEYVPKKYRTEKMCLEAVKQVKQQGDYEELFNYIPKTLHKKIRSMI